MTGKTRDRRRGLGRGLSALFEDGRDERAGPDPDRARSSRTVPVEWLRPNAFQPRRRFDEAEMEALAASVGDVGVLQPILARPVGDGGEAFEIVAGERRWRAAQKARLHRVPVVVRDLDDAQALKIALVENVQREDLNTIEEAEGYGRLMEEFGLTQEAVARAVGKSRSHVANTLRLSGLPGPVKRLVEDGRLSAGHARALLTAADPEGLAARAADGRLTVREVEALAKERTGGEGSGSGGERPAGGKDANVLALEDELSMILGLSVDIRHKGEAGGTIGIRYRTLEQLDDVCWRLRQGENLRHDEET